MELFFLQKQVSQMEEKSETDFSNYEQIKQKLEARQKICFVLFG